MNVIQSASRVETELKSHPDPKAVNLYNDSPNVELSLDEFEVYALKRLKVCVLDDVIDLSTAVN